MVVRFKPNGLSSYSSSHSSICAAAIVLFGRCGSSVPALTFGVSTNFALANFLASRSFGNVLVALTRFRFPRGSSNETYHVPLDLLAMIPSRGLRRRLTDRGRELNRRLTKSFRLPPASPHDSFSAVAGVPGQPSEPERTSVVPGVTAGHRPRRSCRLE